ncbi:MAG: CbtA family protein, partial [Nocardioidaceae bacterium]
MTARSILVRGLVAGLLAGVLAFVVAYELGEPHVEAAIALEELGHSHGHAGEGAGVSRADQRTWGL